MKYRFIFVCQAGELEIKACLLAASLRQYLHCNYELVAAIPEASTMCALNPATLTILDTLKVSTVRIQNPLASDYLIGHKLACLQHAGDADKLVFLDSDVLCLKAFYHDNRFTTFAFNAKLEDWHHHDSQDWRQLYNYCGLATYHEDYRSTVFDEAMPLYFNAGVLAVDAQSSAVLAARWINLARQVDGNVKIPRLRPNLDQLTLPLAVSQLGLSLDLLDEAYNFPGELRALNPNQLPYFCHYHDPHMILCDQIMSRVTRALLVRFPDLRYLFLSAKNTVWHAIAHLEATSL